MDKKEHIQYWIKSSEHDLETAETLFQQAKYDWCLFIGHLVLEKILKAIFVKRSKEKNFPPKIHNLLKLAELSDLNLSDEIKLDLINFNDFNIEIRYPDYKLQFYKKCDETFTKNKFAKIKEIYICLLRILQEN